MSNTYEWMWHVYEGEQTNDLEECSACAAVVPVSDFPIHDTRYGEHLDLRYLCELCASTPAGNAQEYPQQWESQNKDIMQVTNYSANMILLQMGKWGSPGEVPTMNPWKSFP